MAKKTVQVTVIYPVSFSFDVDTNDTTEEQQEKIYAHADSLVEPPSSLPIPVIHICSDDNLVD